ncbi:MAG TPA: tetratricopeptide repeat protein [Permianibacter sp.]|nr:tetratricopeptide repeat protein [Permianibacter sp.]
MKKAVRLLFTLPCLLAGLAVVAAEEDYQRALKLVQQGQIKAAQAPLESYLKSAPQELRGRFLQGVILIQLGKLTEATRLYQDLIEEFPQHPEPFNNLAVLYGMQGQYDKARAVLEMALHTHPSYAVAYENLGDVYSRMASQAYEKALQLDNKKPAKEPNLKLLNELRSAPAPQPVVRIADAGKTTEPAATEPTSTPADAVAPLQPAVEQALKAVSDWAAAWSSNDVERYFAAYASDFQPSDGSSRAEWEVTRRSRIAKPRKIAVQVLQPSVRPLDDGRMQVSFRQHYRSGNFEEVGNKTLILVKSADRWLIQQERTGN